MIFRAIFIFMLLMAGCYGITWTAANTDYFKDRARLHRILQNTVIGLIAIAVSTLLFLGIYSIDHQF